MLGLDWGMPADAALARLGLAPLERTGEVVSLGLGDVTARLAAQQLFCPSLFLRLGDACEGRLHLIFAEGELAGCDLRFRFPFEAIGKPSDGLSDQAMAAFARVELENLLFDLIARYGAPVHSCTGFMRWDHAYPVGMVVFRLPTGTCLQVMMGHDGGGVVGTFRYLPPVASDAGL